MFTVSGSPLSGGNRRTNRKNKTVKRKNGMRKNKTEKRRQSRRNNMTPMSRRRRSSRR